MPDHDLQPREPIEQPAGIKSQDVQPGIGMPAPAKSRQMLRDAIRIIAFVMLEHLLAGKGRMDVQRDIQLLRLFKDGPEFRGVVEFAVQMVVQEGADKTKVADAAGEFRGGGERVNHGQQGEASQAGGVLGDGVGEGVVNLGAQGGRGVKGRVGENLHGDVPVVHVLDAGFSQDIEFGRDVWREGDRGGGEGRGVVLFEGDERYHHRDMNELLYEHRFKMNLQS